MDIHDVVRLATTYVLQFGEHPPVVLVCGTEGVTPLFIKGFPAEHEEKLKVLFRAGATLAKSQEVGKLHTVFFVSEAWMGTNMSIRPSVDPERKEVLIINCLDVLTNKQTVAVFEYIRDSAGKLTELKQTSFPEEGSAKSPLLPAFVAGFTFKKQ